MTQWKQKWMEKNFNLKNYTFGKQKQSKKNEFILKFFFFLIEWMEKKRKTKRNMQNMFWMNGV